MSKDAEVTYEVRPSLFGTIKLGIKAIVGEIHWNVIRFLRQWEIRELKRRLEKRYSEFGRLVYREKYMGDEEKNKLEELKEEIGFLEEEIASLEKELGELRSRIIKERQEKIIG